MFLRGDSVILGMSSFSCDRSRRWRRSDLGSLVSWSGLFEIGDQDVWEFEKDGGGLGTGSADRGKRE
jgi:hypothetical protein